MVADITAYFSNCYIMQREDVEQFACTLADGFEGYNLFEYICKGYDKDKMRLFWATSILLSMNNAICVADSKQINSVLIYISPGSKEPGLISYLKTGGLKLFFKLGVVTTIRLLCFDAQAQRFAKKYKGLNDGYLMAFATRINKQKQGYGKPVMESFLRYLDAMGQGCYLETLKSDNVALYERFGFELKTSAKLKRGNLSIYAMHRAINTPH